MSIPIDDFRRKRDDQRSRVAVGGLLAALEDIRESEVNPLLAQPDGAVALHALVSLADDSD